MQFSQLFTDDLRSRVDAEEQLIREGFSPRRMLVFLLSLLGQYALSESNNQPSYELVGASHEFPYYVVGDLVFQIYTDHSRNPVGTLLAVNGHGHIEQHEFESLTWLDHFITETIAGNPEHNFTSEAVLEAERKFREDRGVPQLVRKEEDKKL